MTPTEISKATIKVNPVAVSVPVVPVERLVENESVKSTSSESHTRIPSSTVTMDSGFADEPSKMKENNHKPAVEVVVSQILTSYYE